MANQKRKAVVKDWRAVPAREGNQGVKPSRVCRDYEGKAGGEESRKAVCCTAQKYSKEDSRV